MAVKFITKKDIVEQVKITDIAEEFNIELESINSGNFNWRCRCPSKDHKNGHERTPSLYIDGIRNNYFCYGCQSSFNCLDFYMICADVDFSKALKVLRKRVTKSTGTQINLKQDNLPILLDISHLFRKTMFKHPDDLKWIDKIMKQTDQHLINIKKDNVKKSKALFNYLKNKIKKRYS